MHSASGPENYYDLLGIQRDATRAEIRRAFLHLAQVFHPDLNSQDLQAEVHFRQIRQAYEVLHDQVARASYDEHLREKNHSAACRQEWPRSKPIVTNPPQRPPTGWKAAHSRLPNRDWMDLRAAPVALFGLCVAAIVLTIITKTHFDAWNQVRQRRVGQASSSWGSYAAERESPGHASSQQLSDAAPELGLGVGTLQDPPPPVPEPPSAHPPTTAAGGPSGSKRLENIEDIENSITSLKALETSDSAAPLANTPSLPPPPRMPHLDSIRPDQNSPFPALELFLPEPSYPIPPPNFPPPIIPREEPKASNWSTPSAAAPRVQDSQPFGGISSSGSDRILPPSPLDGPLVGGAGPKSIFDANYPPRTANHWNTPSRRSGSLSRQGTENLSAFSPPPIFNGPPRSSGYTGSAFSNSNSGGLPNSTWSPAPSWSQPPTIGTPSTSGQASPARSYLPTPLGASSLFSPVPSRNPQPYP